MIGYEGYERFTFHLYEGGDLAPPYGIWDNETGAPAKIGTFSTEAEARACACGMNVGRELCMRVDRTLSHVLDDMRRAVQTLEALEPQHRPRKET